MSSQVGQQLPQATFVEVPYTPELDNPKACGGAPKKVNTQEAFKGKKVVVVSVPGSFTPACHGDHMPAYIKNAKQFTDKGYEVWVVSVNDPFVMSGWRSALGGSDSIHFAQDFDLAFSKALNATVDASGHGLGIRGARYALIADDLKIKSFEVEKVPTDVTVTSADTVLGKL